MTTDVTTLKSLGVKLIGEWTTEATHPEVPGTVVHGTARVEWLEGERHDTVPDLPLLDGPPRLPRLDLDCRRHRRSSHAGVRLAWRPSPVGRHRHRQRLGSDTTFSSVLDLTSRSACRSPSATVTARCPVRPRSPTMTRRGTTTWPSPIAERTHDALPTGSREGGARLSNTSAPSLGICGRIQWPRTAASPTTSVIGLSPSPLRQPHPPRKAIMNSLTPEGPAVTASHNGPYLIDGPITSPMPTAHPSPCPGTAPSPSAAAEPPTTSHSATVHMRRSVSTAP